MESANEAYVAGNGREREQNNPTAFVRAVRRLHTLLAWIFVGCITVQVFLAGLAVFVSPGNWSRHTAFIVYFEFIPVAMFVLALLARMKRWVTWLSLGLYVLIILQYVTAKALSGMWLAALHPVIALLLFWCAIQVARQSAR